MSNRIFQNVIVQLKDATDRVLGVMDPEGIVISCSDTSLLGERWPDAALKVGSSFDAMVGFGGRTFKAIVGNSNYYEYAVFSGGEDEIARSMCLMAYVALNDAKVFYEERHDRGTFVKNILTDNILPGDIYLKSHELHFDSDVSRVCMLIKITDKNDISAYDVLQNLFPDKNKDFIINVNETDIALVKEIKPNIDEKDLDKLANSIVDTLSSEFYTHCTVGIGTVVGSIKELARSFKEAQVALEVGKVFDTEKAIVSYNNLGIARLIYQLPTTLCDMFLKEVFKRGSIDSLDHETLFTLSLIHI